MTSPNAPAADRYLDIEDLAARWNTHPRTARNRTYEEGFPDVYEFGTRSLRWLESEVRAWDQTKRRPARRRTRAVLPRHRGLVDTSGLTMKVTRTVRQVAA